jgi:hypothetical protein
MKTESNPFKTFIKAVLSSSRYGIVPYEDVDYGRIQTRSRIFTGIDDIEDALNHDDLCIFKITKAWEFRFLFFLLPWWEKIPDTLTLIARVKRPDTDETSPLQVLCFDLEFYDHLEIMIENGITLETKVDALNSKTTTLGYTWNPARQLYQPVFETKSHRR